MTGAEGVNFITVRIDDKKCKRCYECIRSCPNKALTLEHGIYCHNAYECAYCEVCMDVCEENAIEILEM